MDLLKCAWCNVLSFFCVQSIHQSFHYCPHLQLLSSFRLSVGVEMLPVNEDADLVNAGQYLHFAAHILQTSQSAGRVSFNSQIVNISSAFSAQVLFWVSLCSFVCCAISADGVYFFGKFWSVCKN